MANKNMIAFFNVYVALSYLIDFGKTVTSPLHIFMPKTAALQ